MSEYKMWIGGKWIGAESGKTYPVFNPANGMEIAEFGGRRTSKKPSTPPVKLSPSGLENHSRNARKLP